ncbi:MAG: hypothetical protein AAGF50_06000, partial [Pseudomonadota bacterium]
IARRIWSGTALGPGICKKWRPALRIVAHSPHYSFSTSSALAAQIAASVVEAVLDVAYKEL